GPGLGHDRPTPLASLDRLWGTVGPVLALGLAGLVIALWRRRRADLVLVSFAVVYWLSLMPQRAHFDRYILPLVPILGVLAGRVRLPAPPPPGPARPSPPLGGRRPLGPAPPRTPGGGPPAEPPGAPAPRAAA